MRKMKLVALGLTLIFAAFAGVTSAYADTLVDRGLPTGNLNNASGNNRSNVAWGFGADPQDPNAHWIAGDDFMIGGSQDYFVDTMRLWTTSECTSVWFGPLGGTFVQLDPNVITSVTYGNGQTYQGNSTAFRQIFQLDFNLNMILSGSTTYQFFLDGQIPVFLHSSNAGLSVSPQQGSDNLMLAGNVVGTGLTDISSWNSNQVGVWDKSSDGNVQVFGTAVPEPASLFLLGTGLGVIGLAAWRRKK